MLVEPITIRKAPDNDIFQQVRDIVCQTLQIVENESEMVPNTGLVGSLAELDSMAVISVITSLENHFGFLVEDDDDIVGAFETLGNLAQFVEQKSIN